VLHRNDDAVATRSLLLKVEILGASHSELETNKTEKHREMICNCSYSTVDIRTDVSI
jgi:ferredoxin-thioredoxin reductase catalytic subunit